MKQAAWSLLGVCVIALLLAWALIGCGASATAPPDDQPTIIEITITASPVPLPTATPTPRPSELEGATSVEEAERRWQSTGLTDYQIRVAETHSVWCTYHVSLEVQDSHVVSGTITAQPGPANSCWRYTDGVVGQPIDLSPAEATPWTVPGLFRFAHRCEAAMADEAMWVRLRFHPKLGYPTGLGLNNLEALDDDIWLRTLSFRQLEP
jgi:hypothetical protein